MSIGKLPVSPPALRSTLNGSGLPNAATGEWVFQLIEVLGLPSVSGMMRVLVAASKVGWALVVAARPMAVRSVIAGTAAGSAVTRSPGISGAAGPPAPDRGGPRR